MKAILLLLSVVLISYSANGQSRQLNAPLNLRWGMSPKEAKDSLEKRDGVKFISADTAEFGVITQRYSKGKFATYDINNTILEFYSDSLFNVVISISHDKDQSELVLKLVDIYQNFKKKYGRPNGSDQISVIEKWYGDKTDSDIWDIIAEYSEPITSSWRFGKTAPSRLMCFIPSDNAIIIISYSYGSIDARLDELKEKAIDNDL